MSLTDDDFRSLLDFAEHVVQADGESEFQVSDAELLLELLKP